MPGKLKSEHKLEAASHELFLSEPRSARRLPFGGGEAEAAIQELGGTDQVKYLGRLSAG